MPSGHSSEMAQKVYDYLFAQYFHRIAVNRTLINWNNPRFIAVWLIVLSVFLFVATRYAIRVHRKRNELYGATSFAGNILERNGKVAIASYVVWTMITLYALYFLVTHVLYGQIY